MTLKITWGARSVAMTGLAPFFYVRPSALRLQWGENVRNERISAQRTFLMTIDSAGTGAPSAPAGSVNR
ncbi:hypothetical protein JCM15908A_00690 [Prevotella dentasini JCM 15908]